MSLEYIARENFKIRHFKNEVMLSRNPGITSVWGDGAHPARQRNAKWNGSFLRAVSPPMTSATIMDRCDIRRDDFPGIFTWTGVRFISIGNKALSLRGTFLTR